MKKMYYIEFCNSGYIRGDVYPLGEMTEKEALKVTEKRIKELYRNDRNTFDVSVISALILMLLIRFITLTY